MKPYFTDVQRTIYHGDNREVLAWLREREERFEMCMTDPPYSDATHKGARSGNEFAGGTRLLDGHFGSISVEDLRARLGDVALLMPNWVVAFMDWRHVAKMAEEPPGGLDFIRFGVWTKPNGMPQLTGDRPAQGWEALAIMHAKDTPKAWNGGGRPGVWRTNVEHGEHPTAKPLKLVRELISLFSCAGDSVIDPWMGSGTTLVAAKDLGRRAVGIELEERWCEVAARRLSQGVLDLGVSA
jgi:site-specific DNA-methyltransferase (adenine-specific)